MFGSWASSSHSAHASRAFSAASRLSSSASGTAAASARFRFSLKPLPVGEVQAARVLVLSEIDHVEPVPEARRRELLSQRVAALVGLDDDVDLLDALQVLGELRLPVARARVCREPAMP